MTAQMESTRLANRNELLSELHARNSPLGIIQRRARLQFLSVVWKALLIPSGCAKRLFDILVAFVLLAALSPILLMVAAVQRLQGRPALSLDARAGRWGVPFCLLELNTGGRYGNLLRALKLHQAPTLINVLRGDMSLIGPRTSRPNESSLRERAVRKRSSVRPGLLSLWWLRKQANIAFTSELEIDQEYVDRQSLRGDLGIALRALPSLFYGTEAVAAPERVDVLGISICNITMEEALESILLSAESKASSQLCFVNTDCVNKAWKDRAYAQLLNSVDAVLADGIGIRIAGKITRREIKQNVNGTDLFPLLCKRLQASTTGLYLLGGRPGIAEDVRAWIAKNYPGVTVSGTHHGYFDPNDEAAVIRSIRDSGAGILLVAFGSPRQDMWISKHLEQTGVGIAMGVGGLFDFYSGRIPRAPQWLRELSLEWVYRLCQEPSRMWKRYLLGNIIFLARVVFRMIRKPAVDRRTI
jgi:N-acetylglucosaminyldiphosphoundecaprenol N-acetyl-beta-D-mannosaminyltransferase